MEKKTRILLGLTYYDWDECLVVFKLKTPVKYSFMKNLAVAASYLIFMVNVLFCSIELKMYVLQGIRRSIRHFQKRLIHTAI